MSFISIILQGLFLYLLGVVLYCYGDTNYVANAEHPSAGKSMSFYSYWDLHLYVSRPDFEIADIIKKNTFR